MLTISKKLFDLFTKADRWQLLVMFAAVLITATIQTFAVASIMPFIALAANADVVSENAWLAWLYATSGVTGTSAFLTLVGVMFLVILVLSNTFSGLTNWWLLKFVFGKNHDLSTRLLGKYLSQPYTEFLDRNTAELSKNILNEVYVVVTGVLIPTMYVFVRGITSLFIVLLLLTVNVTLAATVFVVLGGAYGIIYLFVRGRQGYYGNARLDADTDRFRMAAEALGGLKEIQVLDRRREFVARYAEPSKAFAGYTARKEIVGLLPRYAMETVAFGGILLIIVYLLGQGQELDQFLPTVSLFAFAGYKLLPALQHMFESLTTVRFYEAALDTLRDDLLAGGERILSDVAEVGPSAVEPLGFDDTIRLSGVSFTYPGASTPSLDGVDLTIRKGTAHGLVGGTGSGKTTVVDLILGLLVPQEGALLVDGGEVAGPLVTSWRRHVGYVPQEIFLTDESVSSNVAFGLPADRIDHERVEWASKVAQLDEFVDTLAEGFDTVIGEAGVRLSGGQRQRIGIARALYQDPDVLILDEGTSALDGVTEAKVIQAIQALEPRKTIIWIAHRFASIRDCDEIHLLDQGRIVAHGRFEELMESNDQFRAMAQAAPVEQATPA